MAIIKGALDLTHKTARNAMTPIDMASQALLLPTLLLLLFLLLVLLPCCCRWGTWL